MKFVIALVLTLSFTNAFAGGQTGSGMNGCWIKNANGIREWRSIEEIMYPDMIVKRPAGTGRAYDNGSQWFYVPTTRYFDMTERYYAKWATKRFAVIAKTSPKSYQVFKELFKLFTHVQVSNMKLSGIYKGELSKNHKICKDFSPAMLTFNNGSIVVFKNIFENIDPLSAQILYIHETIRFAQTFHPAFKDLTDADLQRLTALFFTNRPELEKFDLILKQFEDRLTTGSYKKDLTLADLIVSQDYNTESVFRARFLEAVLIDDSNLGAQLNELRINDIMFRELSYKQTLEVLQSANRQK